MFKKISIIMSMFVAMPAFAFDKQDNLLQSVNSIDNFRYRKYEDYKPKTYKEKVYLLKHHSHIGKETLFIGPLKTEGIGVSYNLVVNHKRR